MTSLSIIYIKYSRVYSTSDCLIPFLFGLLQPFACMLDLEQMGRKKELFSAFVCRFFLVWTRHTEDSRSLRHQASTCWRRPGQAPDLCVSRSSLSGRHGSHVISLITNRTGPALPQVNNIDTFKTHITWQNHPLPEANGDCKMYFNFSCLLFPEKIAPLQRWKLVSTGTSLGQSLSLFEPWPKKPKQKLILWCCCSIEAFFRRPTDY